MQDIANSLYPEWKPKPFPEWINKLPRDLNYMFASAYRINGRMCEQMTADGIGHLLPIVLAERANVPETRKIVGKAIWKQLHKSSLTANVKRAKLRLIRRMAWSNIMMIRPCHLHHMYLVKSATAAHWYAAKKAPPREFTQLLHLYADAKHMGVAVNDEWSSTRLKKEHDDAAKAYKLKGVSAAKWAPDMICIIDGFEFRRLVSAADIVTEGIEQRHCVGSYQRAAEIGTLYLFSIHGRERATLMLGWDGKEGLSIQQLYGSCNKRVTNDCTSSAKKLAQFITKFGVRT